MGAVKMGDPADIDLRARGVSVQRELCSQSACAASLSEIHKSLGAMLALPQTMAESQRPPTQRHFLNFSTARKFVKPTAPPSHRRDFTLSLEDCGVIELLRSACAMERAGAALSDVLGRDARLSEVLVITSEPGADGQALHSDASWVGPTGPRTFTMFLAMHDIRDFSMGPTHFCLDTHHPRCFPDEQWLAPDDARAAQEHIHDAKPEVWFELGAGDAVLMDSFCWHRGGKNCHSDRSRTVLAVSFVSEDPSEMSKESSGYRLRDFL